jgi:hypothetical protein
MLRYLLVGIVLVSTKEICKEVFRKNTHGPVFIMCTQIVQNGFSLSSLRVE